MNPNYGMFGNLLDQLWSGVIGERDFIARGLSCGYRMDTLLAVLRRLREVDGIA